MEGADLVSAPVLAVRGVHLRRGARPVLTGVSFEAGAGELVALMGPSGSGKTTILRAVAGLEPFDTGRILVDDLALDGGATTAAATLRALRTKVAMVFQFHCLFEHLSVLHNVWLAPVHAHGVDRERASARAHDLLARLGVDHRAGALPRELSGGEAQRVAIARALAVDPRLLLMDEPTASLDAARRAELGELLRDLVRDGRTLLVATHDEAFAREWATRIVRLEGGTLLTTSY
jgi:ABC-type polar amino acid transport system ATPase subunit